jgi:Flp pilus assembly protein TadG
MRGYQNTRRHGVAIIYIIVVLVVMLGFCSFAVDFGRVQTAKTELRRAADAAARAGIANLYTSTGPVSAAQTMAANDKVDGTLVSIATTTGDAVQVGLWNPSAKSFTSTGTTTPPASAPPTTLAAVQVTLTQKIPLLFGTILGAPTCTVNAVSTAALVSVTTPITDYVSAHGNPWLAGAPAGTLGSVPDDAYGTSRSTANNSHPWENDIANPAMVYTSSTSPTSSSSSPYVDGSKANTTDYSAGEPYESPVPFTVKPGSVLQISVPDNSSNTSTNSGFLSDPSQGINTYANGENNGSVAIYSDDAANPTMSQGSATTSGSENNISNIESPLNSMVGVFTNTTFDSNGNPTGGIPSQESAAPPGLDFSSQNARDYQSGTTQSSSVASEMSGGTIEPQMRQSFYIGDGQTSSGNQETIIVPANATTLYLGTMDGHEWSNNQGGFNATITEYNIELVQ